MEDFGTWGGLFWGTNPRGKLAPDACIISKAQSILDIFNNMIIVFEFNMITSFSP
jgi:hypothetical protein